MYDHDAISRNLKKYMKDKNISINKLARLANMGPGSVWQYVHGYIIPGTYNLYKISRILGIKADDLLEGIDGKED